MAITVGRATKRDHPTPYPLCPRLELVPLWFSDSAASQALTTDLRPGVYHFQTRPEGGPGDARVPSWCCKVAFPPSAKHYPPNGFQYSLFSATKFITHPHLLVLNINKAVLWHKAPCGQENGCV